VLRIPVETGTLLRSLQIARRVQHALTSVSRSGKEGASESPQSNPRASVSEITRLGTPWSSWKRRTFGSAAIDYQNVTSLRCMCRDPSAGPLRGEPARPRNPAFNALDIGAIPWVLGFRLLGSGRWTTRHVEPQPSGDLTNHRFKPPQGLFQTLAVCKTEAYEWRRDHHTGGISRSGGPGGCVRRLVL
jgi:hypothetical protein